MERLEIDIRMFLYSALGANSFLHQDIDEIYRKDEMTYYQSYKESHYYNCPLFNRYTTKKNESIKKVAGIGQYEFYQEGKKDESVMRLIKKGYKFSFNYVNQKTKVDLGELIEAFVKRRGGLDKISENEMFHSGIVAMFLCIANNKSFDITSPKADFMRNGLQIQIHNTARAIRGFTEEDMKPYMKQIQPLADRFLIKKGDNTVDILFDKIIMKEEQEVYDKNPFLSYDDIRGLAFKQGFSKYIGAISGWLKMLGLDEIDITAQKLTYHEIQSVLMQSTFAVEDNNLKTQSEQDFYTVICFVLSAIVKEYKNTQSYYFDDMKTRLYDELLQQRKELITKQKKIEEMEAQVSEENLILRAENKRLQEAFNIADKEKEVYQTELEQTEQNNKELFALREFLFSLEQEQDEAVNVRNDLAMMVSHLKNVKGAIFGGKPNWQNKLKEHLPSFTFINPESVNLDFSFVDNLEVVFVYRTYNNHANYRKLMKYMNKNNTDLHYLPNSTNVDILINKIYKKVGEKNKKGVVEQ